MADGRVPCQPFPSAASVAQGSPRGYAGSMETRLRRGFTIIELLVVITIIGILAALLFPVFARVREKGHSTSCASNLRQIGMATAMYADDYDGRYPPRFVVIGEISWWNLVDPWSGDEAVWFCPSESARSLRLRHYGLNCYDRHPGDGRFEVGISAALVDEVRNPARAITIAEADPDDDREFTPPFPTPWDIGGSQSGEWSWPLTSLAEDRHNDGFNAWYLDGHLKWLPNADRGDREWALDSDH